MKNMFRFLVFCSVIMLLVACGGGGDSGPQYQCTLPCLVGSPTLPSSTVSGAAGGNIDIKFTLTDDAQNIVVFFVPTNPFSFGAAGSDLILNPNANVEHTLTITVPAGTPPGTYYPTFAITANQNNSGGNYYLDPTKSSDQYSYNEVINGSAGTAVLSPLSIPVLTVQ